MLVFVGFMIVDVFGNFYQVNDGVYRSGQLNKYNLDYYLKNYNIKTIINLRGASTSSWYTDELQVAKENNTIHVNYEMWNSKFYNFNQTSEIVNILKSAKKPILIHCAGGADRTSLVSALYQYGIAKKSSEIAKEEFSAFYGYLPYFRKKVAVLGASFDNYVKNIKNPLQGLSDE